MKKIELLPLEMRGKLDCHFCGKSPVKYIICMNGSRVVACNRCAAIFGDDTLNKKEGKQ